MEWPEISEIAILKAKKLGEEYTKRVIYELAEIDKQGASDYWSSLIESGKSFDHNKNGLVLPLIFGITNIDPIKGEKKLFINDEESSILRQGIEIILENGEKIFTSPDTLIKTSDGFVKASELTTDHELI